MRKNLVPAKFFSTNVSLCKKLGLGSLSFCVIDPLFTALMKAFLFLILAAVLSINAFAGDTKAVTYVAEMTGMVCAGCKQHVTESFTKLEGVSKVEIVPGDKPGTQKVTVTSTTAGLTKEQAVTALGASASTYVVHQWKKAE